MSTSALEGCFTLGSKGKAFRRLERKKKASPAQSNNSRQNQSTTIKPSRIWDPIHIHSPSIHHPFTIHSPSIHHPFTIHSPSIHHPFTIHSPSIHINLSRKSNLRQIHRIHMTGQQDDHTKSALESRAFTATANVLIDAGYCLMASDCTIVYHGVP